MNAIRHHATRRAGVAVGLVESLESRRLLAGNITAALDAGSGEFRINGDRGANQVQLTFDTNTAALTLTGENGTTINGSTTPVAVGGYTSIRFEMGKGDDSILVQTLAPDTSVVIDSSLGINTDSGDDVVAFDRLSFRDVIILTDVGADKVSMIDIGEMNSLNIDTGGGGDTVAFGGTFIPRVTAMSISINGGSSKDFMSGFNHLSAASGGTRVIRNIERIMGE
jgi:hypothetical protein